MSAGGCRVRSHPPDTSKDRVYKPDPVPASRRVAIIPLAPRLPAGSSDLPGGFSRASLERPPIWPCSVWGLPCPSCHHAGGALLPHLFTLATPRRGVWGGRIPPDSPAALDLLQRREKFGGVFSVALSLGSPPLAVNQHTALGVRTFLPGLRRPRRPPDPLSGRSQVTVPRRGGQAGLEDHLARRVQDVVVHLYPQGPPQRQGGGGPPHPGPREAADRGRDEEAQERREELVLLGPAQQSREEERLLEEHDQGPRRQPGHEDRPRPRGGAPQRERRGQEPGRDEDPQAAQPDPQVLPRLVVEDEEALHAHELRLRLEGRGAPQQPRHVMEVIQD